jgi:long-chain fatty acid transport protein
LKLIIIGNGESCTCVQVARTKLKLKFLSMRKLLTVLSALLITGSLFAGGLVTNTNQSASWVRLPSRNASTSIDAVYYNPAGLMKLENGFHVSLSNQSIWQSREISNNYAGPPATVVPAISGVTYGLNQNVYKGSVKAPLYPSFFAVYKMDKLAFSLGFGIVGGGGSATYDKGLPSFAMSPSDLVPSLGAKAGVKGYRLDAFFEGSSIFMGFQGGVSYKINDMISIAAGLRYVSAKNTYKGHLQDIQLDMGGGNWLPATTVLTDPTNGLATQLAGIKTIPAALGPAIAGGLGGQNLTVAASLSTAIAGYKASIEKALATIGVPAANIAVMTLSQISGAITAATPALNDQIEGIKASSSLVANQAADVEQTGSGITPIISINISPSENLNIAIKYEMMTKLELTNKTTQDLTVGYQSKAGSVTGALISDMTKPITMFPDGAKTRNDMPAMLSFGVDYKITSGFKACVGMNYYFDKGADYGHKTDHDLNSFTPTEHIANKDIIASNGFSVQGGLEYNISQKLLVSGGYIFANKGVDSKYQSDLTHGLGSNTFGAGGAYSITEKIQLNLGVSYTKYKEDSKSVDHMFPNTTVNVLSTETYKKNAFMVGLGLDLRF